MTRWDLPISDAAWAQPQAALPAVAATSAVCPMATAASAADGLDRLPSAYKTDDFLMQ
jgi:hypothetical protein